MFYQSLLAAADRAGRRVRLIVPGDRSDVMAVGRFGLVYVVAAPRAPGFDRRYRLLMPWHYAGLRSPVARILARERPDIVEVSDKYTLCHFARLVRAGWYGHGPRATVVGQSCERMDDNVAAYVSDRRAVLKATRHYLRHVYVPSFDVHLANSAYTADELRHAAPDAAVAVSPPGVETGRFSASVRDPSLRRALLERAGGGEGSVLVFYAGRLSPEKGVSLLIGAIAELARRGLDARLVLAGEGPAAASLAEMGARLAPQRVAFIGNLSDRATLAAHYASADVFAHPNPREPFGLGPLEAMASGVPVVVPNAGGVLSYAHDGNAWLAAPEPMAFASAIAAAAHGRDETRLRSALATARAYDADVMAGRYLAALDRAHAGRLNAAPVRRRPVSPAAADR